MKHHIFRRYFCLFLLGLCALVALPLGRIVARSVRFLPNDMTGPMSHVKDRMGRDTYLLKVKIPYPGAKFDGVIKYEDMTGEYYVWMEDQAKLLDVRFPGCEVTRINLKELLGEPLTAPRTYELTLDLDALEYRTSDPQTSQDIGSNYVVFTISPDASGAMLMIDGNTLSFDAGQAMTPLLPYGDYAYTVAAPGYSQSQGTVHVISGDVVQETVTLRSAQGTLVVKSATPGTTIKVDDKVVSATGSWIGLLPGASHKVECSHDSYRPSVKMVEVVADQTVTLDFDALPPITGTLPVQVKPIGSQVKVDGKDMGVTPLILKDLTLGSHKIEIFKSGYQTYTTTVSVKEGTRNTPLTADLTAVPTRAEEPKPAADKVSKNTKKDNADGYINGYGYVDLGLPSGTKWATCNVGASSPSDYGDYFAWGEISPKSTYTEDNSATYRKGGISDISANPSMDAACAQWGSTWRLPTKTELEELRDKCTWTWMKQGGHKGYKITGPNGRSIFLPASGERINSLRSDKGKYGNYWSSESKDSYYAYHLSIGLGYHGHYVSWRNRRCGFSVRPVSK